MTKYRISILIEEKSFWIVVDNGKLIRNPTKEDLNGTKPIFYNKTNICPKCIEEKEKEGKELTEKNMLYPHNAWYDKYKISEDNIEKINEIWQKTKKRKICISEI